MSRHYFPWNKFQGFDRANVRLRGQPASRVLNVHVGGQSLFLAPEFIPGRYWLLAALSLALVGAGCNDVGSNKPGESASTTPAPADAPATPLTEAAPPGTPTPETPRSHAVIYVVNKNARGDQDALTPQTVALADPQTPARDAVDALLQAPGSPLAPGTALRGITINDGLATLDFSQSPVNETGGEGGQGEALTALGRTLGQFPEIRRFQIEVKGQLVKSFGEYTTDGPINVTRPNAVQSAHQIGGAAP